MRLTSIFGLCLVFCAPCLVAAGEQKPLVGTDVWEAAYLQGGRAGYVRTTTFETTKDGKKLLLTTVDLSLTLKRFNDVIQIRAQTGNEETLDGKVTSVFLKQFLAEKQQAHVEGTVDGNQLKLVLDGKTPLKPAPWNDAVVGLARQQRLFQEKNVKPGDKFSFLSYEPTISMVVKSHVEVKDYEIVDLPGKGKQRLLRVEAKPEKFENTVLPALTVWLDETLLTLKQEVEVPGLGVMTLYRTNQAGAGAGPLVTLTDIGVSQLLKLNRPIPKPYETTSATYRIKIKGDEDPASTFSRNERQKVTDVKGDSIALQVTARRGPAETTKDATTLEEFAVSNYFINSADAKVKDLAGLAVAGETEPWKKALKIESWVQRNMKSKNHEALATADHVARTLEGDCTEYAMLFAAMCRAEGVPSRTALGLIYADIKQSPVLAFHMWTEVWVKGQWMPLDATLGRGYVGATHLKITDHSWHETRTMTPLLPVVRVLGKMSIEVENAQ